MICASVYLLVFMSVILQYLTDLRSTIKWYGWEGAGQLQEDNLSLRIRIKEMEDALALKQQVLWDSPYYWKVEGENKDGPYCQACFDKDGKLIRLQPMDRGEWYCHISKITFIDKDYSVRQINYPNNAF